jgi:hypothetical protein
MDILQKQRQECVALYVVKGERLDSPLHRIRISACFLLQLPFVSRGDLYQFLYPLTFNSG